MTMPPVQIDHIVRKNSKYYIEFQLLQDTGVPISLKNKTLKCIVKESDKSPVVLHTLTSLNGGLPIIDENNGIFGFLLKSNETNVSVDRGVYDILVIDNDYPTIESECHIFGNITYIAGRAVQ
jgi:hypothetical protein